MSDQNVFHHTIREAAVNVEVSSTTRGPTWKIEVKDAKPEELREILVATRDVLTELLMEPKDKGGDAS